MHMLVKLIFIMAAYQHNIARAGGVCGTPNLIPNTVPVPDLQYYIGDSIRIQCAEGYVRKAGTSNLIRCTEKDGSISWHSDLRLKCIGKSLVCCRDTGHYMTGAQECMTCPPSCFYFSEIVNFQVGPSH
uniref:Sushi domain-containing protein n=1 Tax=Sinocyclocheilus rhinocerous TaxID=307959 RepID=A0A673IMM7_9TELE